MEEEYELVEVLSRELARDFSWRLWTPHFERVRLLRTLKESMRTADCPLCDYTGYVDGGEGKWQTICPDGCTLDDERSAPLRPLMHIPYDPDLFAELNVERYELRKTGKILFSHPQGTHDDRFWAVALGNYAADKEPCH